MMKITRNMMLAVAVFVLLSTTSFAYLDPSVMTFMIQIIAGVVVTVGAVVGIYWRKAKKKAMEKLHIDENAKKEVEEDIVIFDEATEQEKK